MTRPSFLAAPLLATVALFVLAGCSASPVPVPETVDLVGTWRDQTGPVLVLRADGSCRADGLTSGLSTATGPCRWQIGQRGGPKRAPDGHPWVDLDFGSTPRSQIRGALYEVDGSGSSARLYQKINGDAHDRYSLRRL